MLEARCFKVKIFRVSKDKALSKQYHNKRRELWCVLKGIGILDGDITPTIVERGEFVSIGLKAWHRYEAIKPTWVLEIQYGEKCVEEDIVRA